MTTFPRQACPECQSSNNLVRWEYEDKTFERCMTPTCPKNKPVLFKPLSETNPYLIDPLQRQQLVHRSITTSCGVEGISHGEYRSARGISSETCLKMGILTTQTDWIFEYNKCQKRRAQANKNDMTWINYNKDHGLFGDSPQNEYDRTRPIIITEGEFDAASLVDLGLQAWSVAKGAGSALNEISQYINRLTEFKEIILFLDQDKEGQKASQDILSSEDFPIEKVKIVQSRLKDANSYLWNNADNCPMSDNDRQELYEIIENAVEYVPTGIITPTQEALLRPRKPRLKTPFPGLNKLVLGTSQSDGELWVILADPKIGKSTFTKKWIKETIDMHDINVGGAYLEENTDSCALSFITQANEVPLESFKNDMSLISQEDFTRAYDKYIGSQKIKFIDLPFKQTSRMSFFNKLRFLIKKGYKLLIIDHITMLTYDMDEGENERKTIDILMKRLRELANQTGATIIVISHVKRPNVWKSKDKEETKARTVESTEARGSGVFEQVCDVMIALERNMQHESEAERNKLKIKVLLNRITGQTGYADELYWIVNKGIMTTLEGIFK